jgi:hypothetical protein
MQEEKLKKEQAERKLLEEKAARESRRVDPVSLKLSLFVHSYLGYRSR